MSGSSKTASWNRADEATLVHTLKEQKAAGNWGDNNPKPNAWTACVEALTGSEKVSQSAPKTLKIISSRYHRLKQEWDIVRKLRGLSGFGWDDAEQKVTASDEVWKDYLKVKEHKEHGKFKNKAFPLFDEIGDLIDGSRATGANTFRAGQRSIYDTSTISDNHIDPSLREISNKTESATEAINQDKPSRKPGASFYDLENLSSSEDDNLDNLKPPTKKSQKRTQKRAKSEELSDEPHKMRRVSAGQGMNAMAKSMLAVANAMKPSSPPPPDIVKPSNNDPQVDAIAYIERLGSLTESEFGEAFDIIVSNRDFAKLFMTLETEYARMNILRRKLGKGGGV